MVFYCAEAHVVGEAFYICNYEVDLIDDLIVVAGSVLFLDLFAHVFEAVEREIELFRGL